MGVHRAASAVGSSLQSTSCPPAPMDFEGCGVAEGALALCDTELGTEPTARLGMFVNPLLPITGHRLTILLGTFMTFLLSPASLSFPIPAKEIIFAPQMQLLPPRPLATMSLAPTGAKQFAARLPMPPPQATIITGQVHSPVTGFWLPLLLHLVLFLPMSSFRKLNQMAPCLKPPETQE